MADERADPVTGHGDARPGPPDPQGPRRPRPSRGPHPYRLGSLVGAVGASVFVLTNRGLLAEPLPVLALVAWALALAAYGYAVWLRPVHALPPPGTPSPRAGLVYLAAVVAMVAAIALGRLLLDRAGQPELVPALVAACVGLHFLPFARAFAAPVFGQLGWLLALIGLGGLLIGWLLRPGAAAGVAALAAVLAGLVMLAAMAVGAFPRSGRVHRP